MPFPNVSHVAPSNAGLSVGCFAHFQLITMKADMLPTSGSQVGVGDIASKL